MVAPGLLTELPPDAADKKPILLMLADSLSHGTGARDNLAPVVQKGIVDALVAEDSSREVKDSDSGGTVFLMEQSPKYFFHKIRSY